MTKSVPKTFLKKATTKEVNGTKKCGIYMIHNTFCDRKYIGSSRDIERRFKTHKRELEKGSHDCRFLQKDYDEYGEEYFKFIILEENIEQDLLTAYEKCYIYKHDSIVKYKGYNNIMPTTNHKLFKEAWAKTINYK